MEGARKRRRLCVSTEDGGGHSRQKNRRRIAQCSAPTLYPLSSDTHYSLSGKKGCTSLGSTPVVKGGSVGDEWTSNAFCRARPAACGERGRKRVVRAARAGPNRRESTRHAPHATTSGGRGCFDTRCFSETGRLSHRRHLVCPLLKTRNPKLPSCALRPRPCPPQAFVPPPPFAQRVVSRVLKIPPP